MDPLEKSHIALIGGVDSTKNQIDQLVEVMIALEKREENIQLTAVIENVFPYPINDPTRPRLMWIPVDNSVVQKRHIIRDGGSSYHDVVEYHIFVFSAPDSHGTSLMVNIEHPQDDDIVERCHMLEKRLKAI